MIRRRSLVFIISDFISAPGWERPLGLLNRKHEVLAVRLWDPREIELPDIGMVLMQDAETGEQLWVDTHDRRFRQRFDEVAQRRQAGLDAAFRHSGVDVLSLSTEDDLVRAIVRFAARRKQRMNSRSSKSANSKSADGKSQSVICRYCRFDSVGADMEFQWPLMLWVLLLMPVLVVLYILAQRRRQRYAVRYASLSLVKEALGRGPGWRRHVPPALCSWAWR